MKSDFKKIDKIFSEIRKIVIGQDYMIDRLLIGLFTQGHILLEGVPGLAKTLTVKTLSDVLKLDFNRIQFTPDLLPSDLIGTMIFNQKNSKFEVKKGPIFSNIILADEINRSPAKVQSALLESMQERQVTIGDVSYNLDNPFLVLATQNPIDQEGTYPLPEAQRDRFMMKINVNYPTKEDELELLRTRYEQRIINTYQKGRVSDLEKVLSSTSWRQAVYRTQYLKIISSIEQKMTKDIENILLAINKDKLKLESLLRQSISLKRDKQKQMTSLRKMRIKREKELNRIRQDKSALANYMQEKSAGVKRLESIIKKVLEDKARSEREERIRQQQQALKTKEFNLLKGQLPWPTEGRVISKFGKQWNSRLKTTTDNPGIDIKGQPGSPIRSTMSGVVTTITYIRGYGTTVIIDHGGGFYTVYSHVTNIQTQVDSEVRSGDVIAYMGDSGSVNGSKLHFEVWGKGQKLDPEKWLIKK